MYVPAAADRCIIDQKGKVRFHENIQTDPERFYEVHDIRRFPRVQDFSSYARLIRHVKESDLSACNAQAGGKWAGYSNKKIGNHHLKWAIKEAAILFLRESEQAKKYVAKLVFLPLIRVTP